MSKYSLVLEQMDNGVRETIRDANDIFDSELFVSLEKMRENPKFTYSGFDETKMLNSNYATIKKTNILDFFIVNKLYHIG